MDEKPEEFTRPGNEYICSTPKATIMIELGMQGGRFHQNVFTSDEWKNLRKFYLNDDSDRHMVIQAGNRRDVCRMVQIDGIRIMCLISSFLEKREDPVKLVAMALCEFGLDVDTSILEEN